jgi:hypothetical protein
MPLELRHCRAAILAANLETAAKIAALQLRLVLRGPRREAGFQSINATEALANPFALDNSAHSIGP